MSGIRPPIHERFSAPSVMGVVNVTPDSFSDGGAHLRVEAAVTAAWGMLECGAAIVDVGGESTRPGSEGIGAEDELTCIVSVLASVTGIDGGTIESHFEFDIALQLAPELTDWLACIDFGTSSTAIWVGRSDGDRNGLQLRLGQWLERIDPRHEESVWWKPRDAPQQGISYLLPSHIGLSPQINLRADYDPRDCLHAGYGLLLSPGPQP